MPLLPLINRFLASSRWSATRFGREAVNDPRFVHDLRRGREPGRRIEARVRDFLDRAGAR